MTGSSCWSYSILPMKSKPLSTPKIPKRLSLVAQAVDSLCEGIEKGHWQKFLPGERELCEILQVSRRTLRPALEEVQRKGWIEVSGRKRRTIKSGRRTRVETSQKKVIGILMPESFLAMPSRISFVMDTLRDKLTTAGCTVQFHINPACFTNSPGRVLAQFVAEHPAAVWMLVSAQQPMQTWFARQQLKCLILGSCAPGVSLPSVDVDFHATCHHAAGLLLRKGHRRIALVFHKGVYGGDIASEAGLRDGLKNCPGAHVQVLRHDTTTAHLCALLDECLHASSPPTAYLVGGALHAMTVAMHLMHRGRRLGKDVAVLCRDHDHLLEATSPAIAHYAIQPAQMATRIVLLVRQLADTDTVPVEAVRLMPAFVPGESI